VSQEKRSSNTTTALSQQQLISLGLVAGLVLSAALIAYVIAGGPGAGWVKWIALLPAFVGILRHVMTAQAQRLIGPSVGMAEELSQANEALRQQVQDLTNLRDAMLAIGSTFDRTSILDEIINVLTRVMNFDRGLVLLFDQEKNMLTFGAYSHAAPDPESQFLLEQLQLDMEDADKDRLLSRWRKGETILVEKAEDYLDTRLNWLIHTLDLQRFYSVPLQIGNQFKGVIIVDNRLTQITISVEQRSLLNALAAHLAITLENARLYQLTDEQLNTKVQELQILNRIDRELNYTLSVERVLNLTLDWVLRFTNIHAASVVLVDSEAQLMHFVAGYGFDPAEWAILRQQPWPLTRGIGGRVAREGKYAVVSDVSEDPDYVEIVPNTRSQFSFPLTREDRVIAVLTLESPELDAFTEANIDFVQRLAARAAVAVDNARLFDGTRRERQKLELILSNIADAVIVIGPDGKLVLVNQAALATFKLPPKHDYTGRLFTEVFEKSALLPMYERASEMNQRSIEELALADGHTLHTSLVPAEQVGWVIVTHDVTPFKETDKLKNELLATTSHDLKNPLSTIMGYADLISMTNKLNDQGQEYMRRVHGAVAHMRQLIDDLLDMARIESGITLRYTDVNMRYLLDSLVLSFKPQLKEKSMTLELNIPPDLPPIAADEGRLSQILTNLIGNAIKYTPPEGHVWVRAETSDDMVQIVIQDDGLGISPEDQAQVFARFYRVRTAETEAIDGTGLGLAIVKSLVELHGGRVSLESHLGKGSTFHVTLPIKPPENIGDNGVVVGKPASVRNAEKE
jgi:signal transduction histidine kinase/GAF domain-containing protein